MAKDLGKVEQSPADDRSYRALELENGMQVLLIHDPETDKASAAMDVGVGSLHDGDVEGLAHFCEHMLFLGTEKFPDEQSYSKYLNQNGGHSNAYTDMDHTNYFFSVLPPFLEGALDRFAQFFIAPLFTESATAREMQAVDSENNKNIQNDAWRIHQIHCASAKADHPITRFRCGSLKTLLDDPKARGVDVRDNLLHFHDKYYSSNICKLVILGREPLDTQQEWVLRLFGAVRNLNILPPTITEIPFTAPELGQWLEVVPVMDLRLLQLFWPLPPQRSHYACCPTRYISHLLGHEGEGSILSYLKAKGWANELSAGAQFDNAEWASMDVSIDLTDEGVAHVEEVVRVIYAYLHLISKAGPQQYVFDEMQQTAANSFRFLSKQQPMSYTSALAHRMQRYPSEHFISGPHLIREYNPALIQETLDALTPSTMLVMVVAKSYADSAQDIEPWYGTRYSKRQMTTAEIAALEGATPSSLLPSSSSLSSPSSPALSLHLPRPNEFIPSDFTLATPAVGGGGGSDGGGAAGLLPYPLREEEGGNRRLWYKHDNIFKQPKLFYQCLLVSPVVSESPESVVCAEMLTRLVTDKLTEYSYNAALAGLHYALSSQVLQSSLTVSVQGYSHKLPLLTKTILEALSSYKGEEEDDALFARLLDRLVKDYANDLLSQPYQLAMAATTHLLVSPYETRDKLAAAQSLTPSLLRAFIPRFLRAVRVEALVYGNATEAQALSLFDLSLVALRRPASLPLPLLARMGWRVVQLSAEEEVEYRTVCENTEEPNHGLQVSYQLGPQSVALSAHLDLLVLLLKDEAFNELRTKQQLGYIVFCSASGANRHILSLSFLVQTVKDPAVALAAIDAFLTYSRTYLLAMPEEEFQTNVQALVDAKLEKAKNYSEQGNRYWNEVSKGSYVFDRAQREAAKVKTLTKEALVRFLDDCVGRGGEGGKEGGWEGGRKMVVVVHGSSHPIPSMPAQATAAGGGLLGGAMAAEGVGEGKGNGGDKTKTTEEEMRKVKKHIWVTEPSAFKRERPLYPLRPQVAVEVLGVTEPCSAIATE
ncbi:hypothetical protein VYU27_008628 [Nannochloropsis oceanica]